MGACELCSIACGCCALFSVAIGLWATFAQRLSVHGEYQTAMCVDGRRMGENTSELVVFVNDEERKGRLQTVHMRCEFRVAVYACLDDTCENVEDLPMYEKWPSRLQETDIACEDDYGTFDPLCDDAAGFDCSAGPCDAYEKTQSVCINKARANAYKCYVHPDAHIGGQVLDEPPGWPWLWLLGALTLSLFLMGLCCFPAVICCLPIMDRSMKCWREASISETIIGLLCTIVCCIIIAGISTPIALGDSGPGMSGWAILLVVCGSVACSACLAALVLVVMGDCMANGNRARTKAIALQVNCTAIQHQFTIGQKVAVRDTLQQPWQEGVVVVVSSNAKTVMVQAGEHEVGRLWNFIKPLENEDLLPFLVKTSSGDNQTQRNGPSSGSRASAPGALQRLGTTRMDAEIQQGYSKKELADAVGLHRSEMSLKEVIGHSVLSHTESVRETFTADDWQWGPFRRVV